MDHVQVLNDLTRRSSCSKCQSQRLGLVFVNTSFGEQAISDEEAHDSDCNVDKIHKYMGSGKLKIVE